MSDTDERVTQRCTRCVFPDSLPGITFNDEGVCNFCQNYKGHNSLGEDKLRELITAGKKRGRSKYDCIVPLSGGRDSSYVLYLAKEVFGLKTLAVNFNNGFQTDTAKTNIENACKLLDVDFITYRSRYKTGSKTVHYALKTAAKYGLKALAISFCNACSYGYRAVSYIAAQKYNVPLILWGESDQENTLHMTEDSLRLSKFALIRKQFHISSILYRFYLYLQRFEFPVRGNFWRSLLLRNPRLKSESIKEVAVFNYVKWDRKQIKDTISQEMGWEKPADSPTSWRIDCKLEQLVVFSHNKLFGCSKHCFGFHNMINDSQMTRAEALKQELQISALTDEELSELLRGDVGLSSETADQIIGLVKKNQPA